MPESKSKRKRRGRSRRPPAVHTPPRRRRTARWVPYTFFAFMGTGVVVIIANYMGLLGGFRASLVFVGLGLMAAAFVVATRWY